MVFSATWLAIAQEVPNEAPPILGWGAQLLFGSFLVILLVVPWLLTQPPARIGDRGLPEVDSAQDRGGLFSSGRERRLWTWCLCVLAAIYLTLSPAQQVAAALRERGVLGLSTAVAFGIVTLGLAAIWLRSGPGRREFGVGIGVLAVYLTTFIRLPVPEARSHLFEYGLVGMLIFQALLERRRQGRRVPVPALLAAVGTTLLGWIDEGIQAFLPNRVYDFVDVGLNAVFGIMAIIAMALVRLARRWDSRRRKAISESPAKPPGGSPPHP